MSKKHFSDNKPEFKKNLSAEKIQATLQQGIAIHREGRLNEAVRLYESVLQIEPANFDALNLLGTVNAQTRQYKVAADFFRKAIAVNAKVPYVHLNLGNALMALEHFNEALASFDTALALQPNYVEAHSGRGKALVKLMRSGDGRLCGSRRSTN